MKLMSGTMTSIPGSSGPAKATPQSTISHFMRPLRPEAVKGEVHADLAEASERHEDEFVTFIIHLHKPLLDHDRFQLNRSQSHSLRFAA